MNTVNLMGRFTRDPELRYTPDNTPTASFALAVERPYVKGKERKVDFIDCVAWRATAEYISRNFAKGMICGITGRLQVRDWTDKNGNKRRNMEVVVEDVTFGGDRKPGNGNVQEFAVPNVTEEYGYEEYN